MLFSLLSTHPAIYIDVAQVESEIGLAHVRDMVKVEGRAICQSMDEWSRLRLPISYTDVFFSLLIYIYCVYIYIWNVYETIWICNMLQNVARPLADGVDLSAAMLDNQKWYGKASNPDISITNFIQTTEENEVSKSLNFGIDKSIGVKHLGSEDIPMDPQIAGQSSWGRLADKHNFAQQPRRSPKLGTLRSYWILNDTVDGRNPNHQLIGGKHPMILFGFQPSVW